MQNENTVSWLNTIFAKIGVWSIRHRWWVLLSSLLLLGASGFFASQVRIDNGFEAFFNESDPTYTNYLKYRQDFGSDEIAYLMYEVPDREHGVFDLEVMRMVSELTERIELNAPFVKKVRSITNSEVMVGNEDGLDILKLEDAFPEDQASLLVFRDKFMQKELYVGGLVSEDKRYGAIMVEMSRSSIDDIEKIKLDPEGGDSLDNLYPQVVYDEIANIISDEKYKSIKFYVSGDVPLNAIYNRIIEKDMSDLGLASIIIIAILLAVFFRGYWLGVLGPLVVVVLAVVMSVGFLGLMDWEIDMMFGMVPTLLMAIGVAHSVHIISEFRIYHQRSGDRIESLKRTLILVGAPCLLTSLTTAVGFFAMVVSPIQALQHMALTISIGVLSAFFLSITLLPFFLSFGKPKVDLVAEKKQNDRLQGFLVGVGEFTLKYPVHILVVTLLVFVGAAAGIQRISVDSNWLLDFSDEVPIKGDTKFIDEAMGGMNSVVYLFDSGSPDGIKNPEVLKELERFQEVANDKSDIVKKSYSIVDLLKDINQSFNGNDPAYYKIPESQDLVAQYLLVYEMSGGEELSGYISPDYSRASLELRTKLTETSLTSDFVDELSRYVDENPLAKTETDMTGIGALWIVLIDYISESQIRSVMIALVVISILMCLIFGSIKIGLISMIPNIAPVVLTLGFMGWAGVTLDYTKMMIATIAIGIAVDDTIHMMTRLYNEFKDRGCYREALLASMKDVGRALIITSVVLVCGFMIFNLSLLDAQKWFGILLSSTIIVALIADFLVMPALVVVFKPFGPERVSQ